MTYALLAVKLTETEDGELSDLSAAFLSKTRGNTDKIESASMLSLGCWQLNLQTHMPQFSTLLQQSIRSQLEYRVAFFEEEPVWCFCAKP